MNVADYFTSITLELNALKNRVRNFIASNHWQTDGEWKESVLRTVLRRHLPANMEVGRGFIIKHDECSSQIDVLIYDNTKPVLYKDGELVFVTSDAVRGLIEVKSTAYRNKLRDVLSKLADNAQFAFRPSARLNNQYGLFVGLFAYDTDIENEHASRVLEELKLVAAQDERRVVNHISLGNSFFARFWETSPNWEADYNSWRAYYLDNKAPAYFINNLVHTVAQDSVNINHQVWFPIEGKEDYLLTEMPLI